MCPLLRRLGRAELRAEPRASLHLFCHHRPDQRQNFVPEDPSKYQAAAIDDDLLLQRPLGLPIAVIRPDIAEALGVEPKAVRQMEGRLSSRDESFDFESEDDDDVWAPAQFLSSNKDDPGTAVEHQDLKDYEHQRLIIAYESLDERAKEIIASRWLADKKRTLHDLADQFRISAERVRQLEQNALKKLRQQLVTD